MKKYMKPKIMTIQMIREKVAPDADPDELKNNCIIPNYLQINKIPCYSILNLKCMQENCKGLESKYNEINIYK